MEGHAAPLSPWYVRLTTKTRARGEICAADAHIGCSQVNNMHLPQQAHAARCTDQRRNSTMQLFLLAGKAWLIPQCSCSHRRTPVTHIHATASPRRTQVAGMPLASSSKCANCSRVHGKPSTAAASAFDATTRCLIRPARGMQHFC